MRDASRMEWMAVKSRACPSIVSIANFSRPRQRFFFLGTTICGTKRRKLGKNHVIKKNFNIEIEKLNI